MSRSFLGKESERSYVHKRAVEALQTVMAEHGLDAAERVFAEVVWKERESLLWNVNRKRWNEAPHVCHRRLYTKVCGVTGCLGIEGKLPDAMDHSAEWLNEKGDTVRITSEPYQINTLGVRSVLEFCDEHDLDLTISADASSWFPGKTVLVAIDRR